MRKKILQLKSEGKSFQEIVTITGLSKSTVSYHLNPSVREKYLKRQRRDRKQEIIDIKLYYGGKCSKCEYNKCLAALEFHHLNPLVKEETISRIFDTKGKKAAYIEAKKCILVCANCHREMHELLNMVGATELESA